jgi:hypothetical protein
MHLPPSVLHLGKSLILFHDGRPTGRLVGVWLSRPQISSLPRRQMMLWWKWVLFLMMVRFPAELATSISSCLGQDMSVSFHSNLTAGSWLCNWEDRCIRTRAWRRCEVKERERQMPTNRAGLGNKAGHRDKFQRSVFVRVCSSFCLLILHLVLHVLHSRCCSSPYLRVGFVQLMQMGGLASMQGYHCQRIKGSPGKVVGPQV